MRLIFAAMLLTACAGKKKTINNIELECFVEAVNDYHLCMYRHDKLFYEQQRDQFPDLFEN